MAIRIAKVRLSQGGFAHEHITDIMWVSYDDGALGTNTTAEIVTWLDDAGRAFVESASTKVEVGVVRPARSRPYLRTFANGVWTDNLLSLPRF